MTDRETPTTLEPHTVRTCAREALRLHGVVEHQDQSAHVAASNTTLLIFHSILRLIDKERDFATSVREAKDIINAEQS